MDKNKILTVVDPYTHQGYKTGKVLKYNIVIYY